MNDNTLHFQPGVCACPRCPCCGGLVPQRVAPYPYPMPCLPIPTIPYVPPYQEPVTVPFPTPWDTTATPLPPPYVTVSWGDSQTIVCSSEQ